MLFHNKIHLLFSTFIVTFAISCYGIAADDELELKIKAAYLYNFTRFVQWPDSTNAATVVPFNICVLGKSPFRNSLDSLEKRTVKQRPIEVRYMKDISAIHNCQILYVSSSETRRLKNILPHLENKPILTVASIPDFVNRGGMLGLKLVDGKVRLEANLDTVNQSNLIISAKLLEVCWQIYGKSSRNNRP